MENEVPVPEYLHVAEEGRGGGGGRGSSGPGQHQRHEQSRLSRPVSVLQQPAAKQQP